MYAQLSRVHAAVYPGSGKGFHEQETNTLMMLTVDAASDYAAIQLARLPGSKGHRALN